MDSYYLRWCYTDILFCIFVWDAFYFPDTNIFKESSIIYDREWNQLYTIYGGDDNRQYVEYKDISPIMINALVAMEDQRFLVTFDLIYLVYFVLLSHVAPVELVVVDHLWASNLSKYTSLWWEDY